MFFATLPPSSWTVCTSFVLSLVIVLVASNDDTTTSKVQDLNTDIVSWDQLKRSAGYYTESGVWRGGLYLRARNEWFDSFTCEHLYGPYCHSWRLVEIQEEQSFTGTCFCTDSKQGIYCESWECTLSNTKRKIKCKADGSKCRFKSVRRGLSTSCRCNSASANGKYCDNWTCNRRRATGSRTKQDYSCIKPDVSENYCFKWNSSYSTDLQLGSSVCECFDLGTNFCLHWRCKERKIRLCDVHPGHWCNVWYALFVGAPCGAITMILLVLLRPFSQETIPRNFYIVFRSLVLSSVWLFGVLLWGGSRGLPWVFGLWSLTYVFLFSYLIYKTKRVYGRNYWRKSIAAEKESENENKIETA